MTPKTRHRCIYSIQIQRWCCYNMSGVTTVRQLSRHIVETHIVLVTVLHDKGLTPLLPSSLLVRPLLEPLLHFAATRCQVTAGMMATYLRSLPTLTVAIIFGVPGTLSAKHVNSKNDECSEYGTPERQVQQLCLPPTKHHVLSATSSDRLQTDIAETSSLIALNDEVDVRERVGGAGTGIRPAGWPEGENTIEVRVQCGEILLQIVKSDVRQRNEVDLTLLGICADHGVQLRVRLALKNLHFARVAVDLGS